MDPPTTQLVCWDGCLDIVIAHFVVIICSDGHGHGTDSHDRLLTVCLERLARSTRSNVTS